MYCSSQMRRYRRKLRLTLDDVSALTEIPWSTISHWEQHGFPESMSDEQIGLICKALCVEPSQLWKRKLSDLREMSLGELEDIILSNNVEDKVKVSAMRIIYDRADDEEVESSGVGQTLDDIMGKKVNGSDTGKQ